MANEIERPAGDRRLFVCSAERAHAETQRRSHPNLCGVAVFAPSTATKRFRPIGRRYSRVNKLGHLLSLKGADEDGSAKPDAMAIGRWRWRLRREVVEARQD